MPNRDTMYLISVDSGGMEMATTTIIHVRVNETIKAQAVATLADMGLSVSDAVRMLLVRVVAERALPFDVRVPNAETAAAI